MLPAQHVPNRGLCGRPSYGTPESSCWPVSSACLSAVRRLQPLRQRHGRSPFPPASCEARSSGACLERSDPRLECLQRGVKGLERGLELLHRFQQHGGEPTVVDPFVALPCGRGHQLGEDRFDLLATTPIAGPSSSSSSSSSWPVRPPTVRGR
jgi:hypothetical protein